MKDNKCKHGLTIEEISQVFGDDDCKNCEKMNCEYLTYSNGILTCEYLTNNMLKEK